MASRRVALTALVVALGCAPEARGPEVRRELAILLHGDTRFRQEERWIAEDAARAWARFTGGRVRVAFAWDLDEAAVEGALLRPRFVRAEPWATGAAMAQAHGSRADRGGDPVSAWTLEGPPVVVNVVPARAAELYPVVLHELGHVAGLPDLEPDARAVMTPGAGRWAFTARDRAACEAAGVCVGD